MNITQVNAQFSISTEEALRLKFENKLDDIVKHNLAIKLAYEILENNLLDLRTTDNTALLKYAKDETVFQGSLSICSN